MTRPVLRTDLCDMLGIEYPICMAGMGGLRGRYTPPELVAAVSEAGGLGVVGGAGIPPDDLRKAIRRVKELTEKPFGVDLLLPVSVGKIENTGGSGSPESPRDALRRTYPKHVEFVETLIGEFGLEKHRTERPIRGDGEAVVRKQVDVIFEEDVSVFAAGLGDPAWVVPIAREAGAKVMGLVGNVRNAMRQVKADVDVVVAQGTEAGGHTGKIATMPLVPQVRDAVAPLPVVAAGGIANGTGIAAALTLGAAGVWMGTTFLTAAESGLYDRQIDSILDARSDEFVISRSYTGKTARQYKNPVVDAWENSGLEPLPMPLQGMLMADFSAAAERAGRHDLVFTPSGQAAGLLNESRPVAQIVEELVSEAVSVLEAMPSRVTTSAG